MVIVSTVLIIFLMIVSNFLVIGAFTIGFVWKRKIIAFKLVLREIAQLKWSLKVLREHSLVKIILNLLLLKLLKLLEF